MISGSDYKFLSIHNNVKKICEIGTGTGKSTRALSSNGAIIYTMDQHDHNPIFKEKVHHYNIHSRDFWLNYNIKDFDLYFIDATIKHVDAVEIFKRASKIFKIIYHDYIDYEKGVRNNEIILKYIHDKCHTEFALGGSHCAMLECEKF